MMQHRNYTKPPVVEAIIDLHFSFDDSIPASSRFIGFKHRIGNSFPITSPISEVQLGVTIGPTENSQQAEVNEVGIRFSSKESDRILQVQHRAFTFSHLPPYSNWNQFKNEAKDLWTSFLEECRPTKVTRTAVRFINRITIPKPSIELSDYFNLYPAIPEGIPQDTSGVFIQLQMPQTDLGPDAMVVMNLALAEPELPEHTTVLLDFDLFSMRESMPDDAGVWDILDRFGVRKNELFEACITDETRKLFV